VLGTKIQLLGHYSTSKRTKTDFILDRNVQKELKNPFPVIQKNPFNLKENEAVLSYIKGGKRLFFKIENIKRLQSVFFPSAPKR
jgi:hypothetical protein